MEFRLSESQIEEIEEYLTESLKPFEELSETEYSPETEIYENIEELLEKKYQNNQIPDSITHNARKNYRDAVYHGDLLEKSRHGLGKMEYHSGRVYHGE